MRPALVLAGAGVAASLLLTTTVAVSLASDPVIRDCATAMDAIRTANSAHQDALAVLDRAATRARRHGAAEAGVDGASLRVDQAKRVLDGARSEFTRLCHYPDNPTTATSPTPRELP